MDMPVHPATGGAAATAAASDPVHPVPDRHGSNLFTTDAQFDPLLALYLSADVHAHLRPLLVRMGELAGGCLDELALLADKNPPVLVQRQRSGREGQTIARHPAYQALERIAFGEFGLAIVSHRDGVLGWPGRLPPLAKYALTYLFVQAEFGLCCPLSMTDALARTLRKYAAPELLARYWPQLIASDPQERAQGAMFMTEQAAGSDIANTQTLACAQPDGSWRLSGEKWFCSNPDAALALVLARVQGAPAGMQGISLFLLPRRLDDGRANSYTIVRLKDKLGTRSMASGEIRLDGAVAWLVGEPGRGFVQIADMVNHSRLSNGVRAAGLMRRALTEAEFVARERQAFGRRLQDLPLMQRQLDKLRLRTEQARTMMLQTAQALERADAGADGAAALLRILTPLIKFRACRDARQVTGDAMEVRGGCGYIEEWSDPRLVRDAHLGSIWEGTSNIVALDVLRAIRRDAALPALEAQAAALLAQTGVAPAFKGALAAALAGAARLARQAAHSGGEPLARAAASGLYHSFSAIAMAWEAARLANAERLRWAQLVLQHRLLPRDPLAPDAGLPADWQD